MLSYKTDHDKYFSQNKYDSDIKKLNLSKVRCTCGTKGNFKAHASYLRYMILDELQEPIQLSITRVRCLSCNRTHAILPIFIIPYRIFSMPIINRVIRLFRYKKMCALAIARELRLNVSYVRYLIQFYLKLHHQRLLSLLSYIQDDFDTLPFILAFHEENKLFFMQRICTTHHLISIES